METAYELNGKEEDTVSTQPTLEDSTYQQCLMEYQEMAEIYDELFRKLAELRKTQFLSE